MTLGQLDNGLRVILKGLEANDRVIVNGLMRARPGIESDAVTEGERPPGAAAGTPSAAEVGGQR